ncbi:peptidase M24, structural domain-containing protein [Peziza echinospora]|nr:peptidase M24, structural domain-containing protein [Peziza echinospora]
MADETVVKPAAAAPAASTEVDYSLANPDVVTKYKDAATIAQKVLAIIEAAAVDGTTIVSLCEKGDKLIDEEVQKVYKGKKINKGISFPTTVSPADILTPYTPLSTVVEEAARTLKAGELVKIQLGAHIDGFPSIVGSTIIVANADGTTPAPTETQANLLLATHYTTELFLRLLIPPSVSTTGSTAAPAEGEKKVEKKPYTHSQINAFAKKVAETYGLSLVESTTTHMFDRNDIEAKKHIVLNPAEGFKSEGTADVGEMWGVEVALSAGSGKHKALELRPTLLKKTGTQFILKRTTSRATYSEVAKKFGAFPFSLRQLSDERTAKMGVVECVRSNVLRQYDVMGDKDGAENTRVFITTLVSKTGITKITAPTKSLLELAGDVSSKKITDEEILKILALPLNKNKNKSKKK